jgi:hypothetical protein
MKVAGVDVESTPPCLAGCFAQTFVKEDTDQILLFCFISIILFFIFGGL